MCVFLRVWVVYWSVDDVGLFFLGMFVVGMSVFFRFRVIVCVLGLWVFCFCMCCFLNENVRWGVVWLL